MKEKVTVALYILVSDSLLTDCIVRDIIMTGCKAGEV